MAIPAATAAANTAAHIATNLPPNYNPWSRLFLFDAGFGSVALIVALGMLKFHCIAFDINYVKSCWPSQETVTVLSLLREPLS